MSVLVVSGGGQGGWSILGALTEFTNISFDAYVGSSVGAIIVTLVSMGYTASELFEGLHDLDLTNKPSLIRCIDEYGFCEMDNITKYVRNFIMRKCGYIPTFLQCKERFGNDLIITGVCVSTRAMEYFKWDTHPHMSVLDALRITCAVPILFKPVEYNGKLYVDGSLGDNFPLKYATDKYKDENIYGIEIVSKMCEISCVFTYIVNVIAFMIHKQETQCENGKDRTCVITIDNDFFKMLDLFRNMENKEDLFSKGSKIAKSTLNAFKPETSVNVIDKEVETLQKNV